MKHFDENIKDEVRSIRNSSIKERNLQLNTLVKEADETALTFLFNTNAGGLILLVGYIAFVYGNGATPLFLKIALSLFFTGLIFVGLYKAYTIEYYEDLVEHYQGLISEYYDQKIGWADMQASDVAKAGDSKIPYITGYGAFLCFIVGSICAGVAMF